MHERMIPCTTRLLGWGGAMEGGCTRQTSWQSPDGGRLFGSRRNDAHRPVGAPLGGRWPCRHRRTSVPAACKRPESTDGGNRWAEQGQRTAEASTPGGSDLPAARLQPPGHPQRSMFFFNFFNFFNCSCFSMFMSAFFQLFMSALIAVTLKAGSVNLALVWPSTSK